MLPIGVELGGGHDIFLIMGVTHGIYVLSVELHWSKDEMEEKEAAEEAGSFKHITSPKKGKQESLSKVEGHRV